MEEVLIKTTIGFIGYQGFTIDQMVSKYFGFVITGQYNQLKRQKGTAMAYRDGHVFSEEDKAILKKFVNYEEQSFGDIEAWSEKNGFDPTDVDGIFSYIQHEL